MSSSSFSSSSRKELAAPAAPCPPWPDLPQELLKWISSKITTTSNLIRFRGVCRSWRSAAARSSTRPHHQIPFLMLPYDPAAATCSFVNPTNGNVHAVDLPETLGLLASDSSNGWILLISRNLDGGAFLMKPVTRSTIQLPPPKQLIRMTLACLVFMESYPADGDGFVAVLTAFHFSSRFFYCRLGDPDGSEVDRDSLFIDSITSIAYHKGKVYIVDDFSGDLSVWDARGLGRPMRKLTAIPSLKMPPAPLVMVWDREPVIVTYRHADGDPMKPIQAFGLDADASGDLSLRPAELRGTRELSLFFRMSKPLHIVGSDACVCGGNAIYSYSMFHPKQCINAYDFETGRFEPLPYHLDLAPYPELGVALWFTPTLC